MTLNQLRYFCTASRCHSITKAAEELYVTQPTISMAIRDLEIEFGISLFSRKGNQLSLTQEGESFYKKATYILQYCNELQADYSSMSRIKPPLRIGIPPMLSTVFFPELLTAFHEKHPEIAVVLEEYGSVRACNLVQDDTLDVALVNMEQYNIDKFHNTVLANDQVVFCVSNDHNMPEWAHKPVQWCLDNGIVSGTDDAHLDLNNTKLWVCVVLYRAVKFVAGLMKIKI